MMLAINGRSLTQHSFASDDTNRRLAHHALRPHTLSRHNHVRRSRLADGRGALKASRTVVSLPRQIRVRACL